MSADNGIYILRNPKKDNPTEFEFRVVQCSAIDNISLHDPDSVVITDDGNTYHIGKIYEVLLFSHSIVYNDKLKAMARASDIEDDNHNQEFYTEYGIRTIYRDDPFPELSHKEAKILYDQYFMS